MSDPTRDIAWDVVAELLDRFRAEPDLAGVGVFDAEPGDLMGSQALIFAGIDSNDLELPLATGARVPVTETYDLRFELAVFDMPTVADCYRRLGVILGACESLLRDDLDLGELPGLSWAYVTDKGRTVTKTPEGVIGSGAFTVSATTRLE